jgi:hypothetical protein
MNGGAQGSGMSWTARLLIGLVLLLIGAAAATWGLAHYQPAAKFLGVVEPSTPAEAEALTPKPVVMDPRLPQQAGGTNDPEDAAKISTLEQRVARVEQAAQRTESFAGRADALVVAFAARRAIDRGVALGYLEPLLVDRFGAQHQAAVATVITASRQPVRLNDLTSEYEAIGEDLRRGGPEESWWNGLKRELGSVVEVHKANRPAMNADARYNRALARLNTGDVDQALAETMRLPGASRAGDWTNQARRYVAAHRALDEIESAALLGGQAR